MFSCISVQYVQFYCALGGRIHVPKNVGSKPPPGLKKSKKIVDFKTKFEKCIYWIIFLSSLHMLRLEDSLSKNGWFNKKKIKLKLITTMNLIYFLSETFWKTKMITFIIKNSFLIPFIRQGILTEEDGSVQLTSLY